jgi:NAD(P)H-dependent FMN reductase
MISIIVGTDRPQSHSANVAQNYKQIIEKQGHDTALYSLADLPSNFFSGRSYGEVPESFEQTMDHFIAPSSHVLFVVPEYNGSFPGVLKYFIDTLPPGIWKGKRAALAGVATGRAGNLRGLDHFTGVLNYLKVEVYHNKPLFSSIHLHIDGSKAISNPEYQALMSQQMEGFVKF